MDFSSEQRLAIRKFIIELPDPFENCDLAERRSKRSDRFIDDAFVFYDNDVRDLPSTHNLCHS